MAGLERQMTRMSRCGGIGRRTALKMRRGNPCRFKSDHLYDPIGMTIAIEVGQLQ